MTKTLLGNLAAFNTVLQFSLPNTQSLGGMSSGDNRQPDQNNLMNALVSGSVADHSHPDYSRYESFAQLVSLCAVVQERLLTRCSSGLPATEQ